MEAVFISQPGYDATTGLNTGDLGFQSLQGSVNGQKFNSPTYFNPGDYGGLYAPGYLDFGSSYDPGTNSSDYFYYGNYGEALAAQDPGLKTISYGSAKTNSLAGTPGDGDPMFNGVDYTSGASYANEFSQGQGTWSQAPSTQGPPRLDPIGNPLPGSSQTIPGQWSLSPYTPTTEPGYRPPQYSAGDARQGPLNTSNQLTFYYGNNGSAGSLSGTSSNTTPGQPFSFYQNQPSSLNQSNPNTNLGTFTQPSPSLQALYQSRSLN